MTSQNQKKKSNNKIWKKIRYKFVNSFFYILSKGPGHPAFISTCEGKNISGENMRQLFPRSESRRVGQKDYVSTFCIPFSFLSPRVHVQEVMSIFSRILVYILILLCLHFTQDIKMGMSSWTYSTLNKVEIMLILIVEYWTIHFETSKGQ